MEVLTTVAQHYINTFSGLVNQFINWGNIVLITLFSIQLIWMCLWFAFDSESISKTLSQFLRKSFIVLLFFTLMAHPAWLMSILKTSTSMGNQLTGLPVDPSSIITNGIVIANKIIEPITKSSLLTLGIGALVALICYVVIIYCFITVALDLAITLITSTALVSLSPLLLGFSGLPATSQIANQTLQAILGNAVKLLAMYIVVGIGAKTIDLTIKDIPSELISFDPYCWILATTLLFFRLSKSLPNQLAGIVSHGMHDHQGSDIAGLAMTASRTAPLAMKSLRLATGGLGIAGKAAGSMLHNAGTRLLNPHTSAGLGRNLVRAGVGVTGDAAKSGAGTLSDHFKHILNKAMGGPGKAGSHPNGSEKPIPGFSERMYQRTQDFKAQAQYIKNKTDKTTEKPISTPNP